MYINFRSASDDDFDDIDDDIESEKDDGDVYVTVNRQAPTSAMRRVLPAIALSAVAGAVSAYLAISAQSEA